MSDDCTKPLLRSRRSYQWFYDQFQSRYYDLLISWCFLPFGGENRIRRQLLEPIAFGPTEIILDVGRGTGSATFTVAAKAGPQARIVGLDLSRGQIRKAQAKNRYANVSFVQGDATSTCFPERCFDKVLITHAIHEMKRADRTAALGEARRILKDDGMLVVLELDNPPNLLLRLFVGFWWFYWLPFNFETPTRRDMFRHGLFVEVREAGFEEVKKSSFGNGLFQVVAGRKRTNTPLASVAEMRSAP